MQQNVGDASMFLKDVKQRLETVFIDNWFTELNQQLKRGSNRPRTYVLFCNFQFQPYALTRLRVSSHCLEVERGRWLKLNKIPFENRKCQYCNVLEDEFHFIFECPMYNNIRHIYLQDY